jgi:hypothetical protein
MFRGVYMLKTLKKTIFILSIIFVSCTAFITVASAKEVKCNYGSYIITLKDDAISASLSENPGNYYSLTSDALRADDLKNSDGTFKCPSKIYTKTVYGAGSRSATVSLSFLSSTYSGATSTALTSGTVDGTDINSQTPATGTTTDGTGDGTGSDGTTVQPSEPIKCSDFEYTEAGKTYNILKEVFQIMMMAGPILLIIFGIVDFSKASLASDEQALKKAGSNFVKRSIAAVLLFLIPFIINIIIGIAFDAGVFGDLTTKPDTCVTD